MSGKSYSAINLNPDRPIERDVEDRLGFSILAQNLAKSILTAGTEDGFVIGIEGAWGCGKSSILNLVCNELEKTPRVSVVRFLPWIVGKRESLVSSLISDISAAIEDAEKSSKKHALKKTKALAEKFKRYGALTGKVASPFAGIATLLSGVGGFKEVADALASLDQTPPESIAVLKEELIAELLKIDRRIVVVIDDIDRLEPDEAVEITRLVRAVGDFPNVTYILCYDKKALCKSLEVALKIESGSSYLQKITQASFAVPKPEEFDLRRWLNEECHKLYYSVTEKSLTEEQAERLAAACDSQGEAISTPREVHLIMNSLRLYYPPVAGSIDFPDLCWLHIVKIKNEAFYKWIEEYLSAYSIVFNKEGSVSSTSQKEVADNLLKCLGINGNEREDYTSSKSLWRLKDWLPGIGERQQGKIEDIVFNSVADKETLAIIERDRRLASPNHYRLFFAFSQPSGALDDAFIASILDKAAKKISIVDDFKSLIDTKRPQGGTLYELFIDYLARQEMANIPESARDGLLDAVAETIDEGMRNERERGFWGIKTLGSNGKDFLRNRLSLLDAKARKRVIKKIFGNAPSLGWLMSQVVGSDIFSHGRIGDRTNIDKAVLTDVELDEAIKLLHGRLTKRLTYAELFSIPEPLTFLYRWKQSGGDASFNQWLKFTAKSDDGFLSILEMCRGWTASSDGVFHPLRRRDLSYFMDADAALKRLKKIDKTSRNRQIKNKASELLTAVKQGAWERDQQD